MRAVRIGGPIALMVVGLIIYLALNIDLGFMNIKVAGGILALAGLIWLGFELLVNGRQKAATSSRVTTTDAAGNQSVQQRDSESDVV